MQQQNGCESFKFPFSFKFWRQRMKPVTSQRVRPSNNTVRAPAETLRPSNSALPRLHGANLDSLVIRNPPRENKPCYCRHMKDGQRRHLDNTDTTLEHKFSWFVGGFKNGFRWRYFFLSGSLTYSVEDYFLLCFGFGEVVDYHYIQAARDNFVTLLLTKYFWLFGCLFVFFPPHVSEFYSHMTAAKIAT